MNHDEENPISKLLQMRRQQQPPPEYFENFLREFQQRQRSELLRRPAWRIALERIGTRFSESYQAVFGPFSLAHVSYAGASVAVLAIAGVFTLNMVQHPGGVGNRSIAKVNVSDYPEFQIPQHLQTPIMIPRHSAPVALSNFGDNLGDLNQRNFDLLQNSSRPGIAFFELTPEQVLALQEARREAASQSTIPSASPTQRQHPQYILDARPATYEPPVSF